MKANHLAIAIRLMVVYILINSVTFGQNSQELYSNGKLAYDQNLYLDAVKLLFAYQQIEQSKLNNELNNIISNAIYYCDEQLKLAIETKKALDEKGNVTEVVIESGGKFDGPDMKTDTVAFVKPIANNTPKPNLPDKSSQNYINLKTTYVGNETSIIKPVHENKTDSNKNIETTTEQCEQLKNKYLELLEKYNTLLEKQNTN
jgi:hypothetical protein